VSDLIERLRDTAYEVDVCYEAAGQIERLSTALHLACGLLSTYEDHSMFFPDQLVQQFLDEADKEARNG
jgi:hypothetical protein